MRTPALFCFQRKRGGNDNESRKLGCNPAPNEARIRYEKHECNRNALCRDCAYAGDGFVCWHDTNHCLRTDMMRIQNRRK